VLFMMYGIAAHLDRRKCSILNSNSHVHSHVHMTILSMAIPDAEILVVRFLLCVVAE